MAQRRWVSLFEEGSKDQRALLGGKGAGLAEMSRIGLPVPPGFTITTEACIAYFDADNRFPEGMWDEVQEAMGHVEGQIGRRFGDPHNPLLISVRSGAKFSMPGMMDTVLNLGLNDEALSGLIELSNDEHFGYDAYRRLIQMFGDVVLGVDLQKFEDVLQERREANGVGSDAELPVSELADIVERFKGIIEAEPGKAFPQDPTKQLEMAIEAVFSSWNIKRARDYREFHGIPHDLGTAVNIQTMVFGNMGENSASGVAFTRNPSTGERGIYGEYLKNAQGEDVVAGIRTPKSVSELQTDMPAAYDELVETCETLEAHYQEMQDLEFTVEHDKFWILQTRTGKRTAKAATVIAVDMADEGLIDRETAVQRVTPDQIEMLLHPRFETDAAEAAESDGRMLAQGLNASPGAAVGKAVFDADTAEEMGKNGEDVILVRPETTPDDVHGFLQCQGVLTQRGGMTSHAAIVSRSLGKPAVVGCEAIRIDLNDKQFTVDGTTVSEGDVIGIDGTSGKLYKGELPTVVPKLEEEHELTELLGWSDEFRQLGVRANADYPQDATRARNFGAQGIGLCRTEHMFFEEDRLPLVREMILTEDKSEREAALAKLLPMQREDFKGLLQAMDGLPVIIRLIDPPLHEFLPNYEELVQELAELHAQGRADREKERLLQAVERMREANPMLGLRGVRLGMLYPEILEMQTRAILEAAGELADQGVDVHPEIMIPLVAHARELEIVKARLEEVAQRVESEQGVSIDYQFGTMIELPRTCIVADEIAESAEFFSFGTNDLTQTTFGISRDDAQGTFLVQYQEDGVFADPFVSIDQDGVGELMSIAAEKGKATRPDIEIGICGEHGGDPASIAFCHNIELDYVSCSPFRVPVARLAAAQAALGDVERDV